ncbi:MAG: isoaspartyl peptidase/L-asparaginase [Polyangiaceae bacterium]|nr:isoaspartyl peptidase/L-asparaginase [Polyangiaceae bacterium]
MSGRVRYSQGQGEAEWSILVHGGAGDVPADRLPAHRDGCARAARAGAERLRGGGGALDAVQAAVMVLEDDPCFNAGTGACLTEAGTLELDAALMSGADLRAGGVCALPPFRNPIAIARGALDEGRHVLYAGAGAAAFARSRGFRAAEPESMITEAARSKLAAVQAGQGSNWAGGTVGAVARDRAGHVAAATSTGGTAGKRLGRVGDSPLLGAGTYADDAGGAASATGHGEGILRLVLAGRAVAAMVQGDEPEAAARAVIAELEARVGSSGGIILVDRRGRLGLARSTATMTWGALSASAPEAATGD